MSNPTTHTAGLLRSLANWKVLIVSGVVAAGLAVVLFASSGPGSIAAVDAACGDTPPDVAFYTAPADIDSFLVGCGVDGRAAYRDLQIVDLFYPAASGVFMASALALALRRRTVFGRPAAMLAALPLIGAGFDYVENVAAWVLLATFPSEGAVAASLMGMASAAKQALNWTAGVILIGALVVAVVRWLRGRLRPESAGGSNGARVRQPQLTS